MKTIQVRLSDEEEANLQERVRLTGCSISSLVRDCLFRETAAREPELPASSGQVEELARQVAALSEAVRLMAAAIGKGAASKPENEVAGDRISGDDGSTRQEEIGREPGAPAQNFAELLRCVQEQQSRPFGLDLPFVQTTLMAVFALARGSFTRYPEEWEPFKDEAWCRAFAREEEAPCSEKS